MKNLICFLFGHKPYKINHDRCTSRCARCPAKLKVAYDFLYGETIVVNEEKPIK